MDRREFLEASAHAAAAVALSLTAVKQKQRQAPTPAAPQAKPVLLCYQFNGCPPCAAFKRDVAAGHFAAYDVQYRPTDLNRWPQYPVFEYRGQHTVGYSNAANLHAWLRGIK